MSEISIICLIFGSMIAFMFGIITFLITSKQNEILDNQKEFFKDIGQNEVDKKGLIDEISNSKEDRAKMWNKLTEHHGRINKLEKFKNEIIFKHNILHIEDSTKLETE